MPRGPQYSLERVVYVLLFVIIFFFIIIVARRILMPISLGFLFATLIYPVADFFKKRLKFPKALSILTSVLMFVALIIVFMNVLITQLRSLVADFPALKIKAQANLEYLRLFLEESFGIDPDIQHIWLQERVNRVFDSGSSLLTDVINATSGTLFVLFLIPVFMFYLLSFREQFKKFMLYVAPLEKRRDTDKIMKQISVVIQKYISGVFTVVLILCFLNSAGLYIVGLKYAVIFGIVSALFNLIPYFGTWIGASLPITFALLTGETPQLAVSVFILFAIIQFTENNILTPNITGGYVQLNPLFTILSIIAGGMVWGVTGMLIVIPFMATLKIVFENFESTKPIAFLIGNNRKRKSRFNIQKLKKLFVRS